MEPENLLYHSIHSVSDVSAKPSFYDELPLLSVSWSVRSIIVEVNMKSRLARFLAWLGLLKVSIDIQAYGEVQTKD